MWWCGAADARPSWGAMGGRKRSDDSARCQTFGGLSDCWNWISCVRRDDDNGKMLVHVARVGSGGCNAGEAAQNQDGRRLDAKLRCAERRRGLVLAKEQGTLKLPHSSHTAACPSQPFERRLGPGLAGVTSRPPSSILAPPGGGTGLTCSRPGSWRSRVAVG